MAASRGTWNRRAGGELREVRRAVLASYYDNVTYADRFAGKDPAELEADGMAGDTIVFFFSDHGQAVPRAKSWCFESSLRVLFVIRFPGRYERLPPAEPGQIVDSVPIAGPK